MSERKPFLLRLDPDLHRALQRWADDDLRSLNGQIEFLLRKSLRDAGRSAGTPLTGTRQGGSPPSAGEAPPGGADTGASDR